MNGAVTFLMRRGHFRVDQHTADKQRCRSGLYEEHVYLRFVKLGCPVGFAVCEQKQIVRKIGEGLCGHVMCFGGRAGSERLGQVLNVRRGPMLEAGGDRLLRWAGEEWNGEEREQAEFFHFCTTLRRCEIFQIADSMVIRVAGAR